MIEVYLEDFVKRSYGWLSLVFLLVPLGCGGGTVTGQADGKVAVDGSVQDGNGQPDFPVAANLTKITIDPPSATLLSTNGSKPTKKFTVMGHYDDGKSRAISSATMTLDSQKYGTMTGDGTFTARGIAAGETIITAAYQKFVATGKAIVTVKNVITAPKTSAGVEAIFTQAPKNNDPARAAVIVYPEDKTLFPLNVYPPDLQWEGGKAGDHYHVKVSVPNAELHYYVTHSGAGFKFDWPMDKPAWRAIAESAGKNTATILVERYDASKLDVVSSKPVTFSVAEINMAGTIYYWALSKGRIFRIRSDGSGPEDFFTPPAKPGAPTNRCVACHTMCRDGKKMAFEYWGGSEWGGIIDVTKPSTPIAGPNVYRANYATFNPKCDRLIANYNKGFKLLDVNGAMKEIGSTNLPTTNVAMPNWSPDGKNLTYISNIKGNWEIDFSIGDVTILPYLTSDKFGVPKILVPNAGKANYYPIFTPNSQWIAYSRGAWSRSELASKVKCANASVCQAGQVCRHGVCSTVYPADIFMVSIKGGTPVRLATLGTGGSNHMPTFSPFTGKGLTWMAFFSMRDYGNAQAGTKGAQRRQIWVAAVKEAVGTIDPSYPAFWLPRQDKSTENMTAYWAPDPCKQEGQSCNANLECCSGFCASDGKGGYKCVPPTTPCAIKAQACKKDEDCCAGLKCLNKACGAIN